MGPKNSEDPEDKKARLRDRRQSLLERRNSAEDSAGGITSDLRSVYGLSSLFNFGKSGSFKKPAAKSAPKAVRAENLDR